jgi:hypothetical protein
MLLELEQATSLGPATVLSAGNNRALLQTAEARVCATIALPYIYQPAVGDLVLAIGRGDDWYVIGILCGTGKTTLTAAGDLDIRAPHGRIELSSGQAIRLRSPDIRVVAGRLALVARTAKEQFGSASRSVKEGYRLCAATLRTVVTSTYRLRADRIVERAEGEVKIDGHEIRLG